MNGILRRKSIFDRNANRDGRSHDESATDGRMTDAGVTASEGVVSVASVPTSDLCGPNCRLSDPPIHPAARLGAGIPSSAGATDAGECRSIAPSHSSNISVSGGGVVEWNGAVSCKSGGCGRGFSRELSGGSKSPIVRSRSFTQPLRFASMLLCCDDCQGLGAFAVSLNQLRSYSL